ncbi:MAG: hypothetical protein HeimAB125_11520 [Candidatus Heimdallarchaeota archaeon AB_125]|nr:MAG: hypothetical protein HeimAB125_11520 [Candidatus Heimdallarchaeota archaeon AB_125]
MGRRVVKKVYKNTYARGQRDTKEFEDTFLVRIELISIKVLEDRDLLGNESEFYFRVGLRPNYSGRIPNRGSINLEKNEVFQPPDGMTLYSEFRDAPRGGVVQVPFHVFERDPGKNDDKIVDHDLAVPLGSSDYKVITQNSVKVKLKLSGLKTRY